MGTPDLVVGIWSEIPVGRDLKMVPEVWTVLWDWVF